MNHFLTVIWYQEQNIRQPIPVSHLVRVLNKISRCRWVKQPSQNNNYHDALIISLSFFFPCVKALSKLEDMMAFGQSMQLLLGHQFMPQWLRQQLATSQLQLQLLQQLWSVIPVPIT